MDIRYARDADLSLIKAKRVAVIGYGAQGHAHALNLRDSGVDVVVALHAGARRAAQARQDGFEVVAVSEAARTRDMLVMCAPDEVMPDLYAAEIGPHLRAGQTLMFVHGFAYHYGFIAPPREVDVAMVAPKGPGTALRAAFTKGGGLPCIVAVGRDNGGAEALAYAYAAAIGCGRAGMIASSFKIETEGDLYGEQAVLCGGLSHLIRTAWEVQVEAGTPPELAYFDCLHEVKLLSDLIHERGIAGMHLAISNTAEYGEYVTGPRIIDARVKDAMRAVMADVQSGTFAQAWMAEHRAGAPDLKRMREAAASHPIEAAGETVRSLLSQQSARPPAAWFDLKGAVAQLEALLRGSIELDPDARRQTLLRLLSALDVAILGLPDTSPSDFDDYEISPQEHRAAVGAAFPEFGYYDFVRPDPVTGQERQVGINDAVSDLEEIVRDLEYALAHESLAGWERAAWEVKQSYAIHFGSHLHDLRSYVYRLCFPAP